MLEEGAAGTNVLRRGLVGGRAWKLDWLEGFEGDSG